MLSTFLRTAFQRALRWHAYDLSVNAVEDLSLSGGEFASTGSDPRIVLRTDNGHLPSAPFSVTVAVADTATPLSPRLYIDEGSGFHEERSVPLSRISRRRYHAIVSLGRTVRRLRLDPAETSCHFRTLRTTAIEARPQVLALYLSAERCRAVWCSFAEWIESWFGVRRHSMTLQPLSQIASRQDSWMSEGMDPQFLLRSDPWRSPPRRWVRIHFHGSTLVSPLTPKLYVNRGAHFYEEDCVELLPARDGAVAAWPILETLYARYGSIRSHTRESSCSTACPSPSWAGFRLLCSVSGASSRQSWTDRASHPSPRRRWTACVKRHTPVH